MKLIGICGKAGSGKSTVANIIENCLKTKKMPAILSFSNEVKKIAKSCFGWNGEKDENGRKLLQMIGKAGRLYDKNIWIKYLHKELMNYIYAKINLKNTFDFVIIDDVRFDNEAKYVLNDKNLFNELSIERTQIKHVLELKPIGKIIKIEGRMLDLKENSKDESENGLTKQWESAIINNSGNIDDLKKSVYNFLKANEYIK